MAHKQSKQALKRRADKRHQRTLTKKAQARTSASHAAGAGLDRRISWQSPLPKLSEQIWDYAEPLLVAADNREAQKRAAGLAIICWNAALLPASDVERLLGPTIEELAGNDARLQAELLGIFLMMQDRKRKHFAADNRLVVNYSLTDTSDGVHLLVASTAMRDRPTATLPA